MRIDHIMIFTSDIEREIRHFNDLGLGVTGGLSFGDGVANKLIPLPAGQYLELLYLDGEGPGADWLRRGLDSGRRYGGWAVETKDLADTATRLGRPVEPGMTGASGEPDWHTVTAEEESAFLPFFITYRSAAAARGERLAAWVAAAQHRCDPQEITSLDLVGDAEELRQWIGAELPLNVTPGEPARLDAIRLRTGNGELVLPEH